jgi:hypothetical protein
MSNTAHAVFALLQLRLVVNAAMHTVNTTITSATSSTSTSQRRHNHTTYRLAVAVKHQRRTSSSVDATVSIQLSEKNEIRHDCSRPHYVLLGATEIIKMK